MSFQPDPNMHWTEPFVRHIFAVIRGAVAPGFCTEALEEVRKIVDDLRLLTEWAEEKLGSFYKPFFEGPGRGGFAPCNRILESLFDQPDVQSVIVEKFASMALVEVTKRAVTSGQWENVTSSSQRGIA